MYPEMLINIIVYNMPYFKEPSILISCNSKQKPKKKKKKRKNKNKIRKKKTY